jgi:hypothetical protein
MELCQNIICGLQLKLQPLNDSHEKFSMEQQSVLHTLASHPQRITISFSIQSFPLESIVYVFKLLNPFSLQIFSHGFPFATKKPTLPNYKWNKWKNLTQYQLDPKMGNIKLTQFFSFTGCFTDFTIFHH